MPKGKTLDEVLEEDTDERGKLKQFDDVDNWSRLSGQDFAHKRSEVFRELKRVGKQRQLVQDVKRADAEAEAAKRRAEHE